MTNKAKTYLKNIQGADTEKKLIGIEIAFKQDMTLSCSDLGSPFSLPKFQERRGSQWLPEAENQSRPP